jgi:hypothetical protein
MLRNKQHSRKDASSWDGIWGGIAAGVAEVDRIEVEVPEVEVPAGPNPGVAALADLVDSLDLAAFLSDPAYRHRLNQVLDALSDEEFDCFEHMYTSRFIIN